MTEPNSGGTVSTTESHAETMRRAAKLMRERGEAATTGEPWKAFQNYDALYGVDLKPSLDPVIALGETATAGMEGCSPHEDPRFLFAVHERAEYIAAMHPGVAKAVSDWLEVEASAVEMRGNDTFGHTFSALNVARAYLGESAS